MPDENPNNTPDNEQDNNSREEAASTEQESATASAPVGETPSPGEGLDPEGEQDDAASMLDVHSMHVDTSALGEQGTRDQDTPIADAAAAVAETAQAVTTPVAEALGPVVQNTVQATVQATQTAVQATKQASQQVTAAVQQQAQKITVAPRKALYRGKRFLAIYGGLVGAAGVLAILAKRYRYFPADVGITKALQKPNSKLYDAMMHAVSELGWRWISVGTRASLSTLMWAAGFRMESAFTVSTWSGDLMTIAIKTRVLRPRPTKDLVRVMGELDEASFPSGHVVHYVTFYGFLFYLVFIHLKQRWFRTALLTLLAGIILLVGPSRVYMGHHWPSDVGGAYLVGTLWLGITIIAYLETKARYTLHTTPPFFVKRPQQLG
ncbi:MAG: phosphatase PAP2 family protein [Chloroflexota bacterium]|nr:phosphatase PAP2 family protein [Chloroflexota bacterium]MDQ5865337.1 phosphatase PAP2 family protein [Chloroflexota bacterium]